jgi:3-oxosteroid 1-dehydrogenase
MAWDFNYDVIVIGSGCAGLAGALAAHESGLKTVLLEKSERLGGGTSYSYGLIWVGCNHLAREIGISDDAEEVLKYMRYLGGGHHSEERVMTLAEQGPKAVAFLTRCGVKLRVAKGVKDIYFGTAPGATAGGRSIEHEPISGYELGEWRERVLLPPAIPYQASVEEFVAWGGIHNDANWDQAILEDRRKRDFRAMGAGLVSGLVKALTARGVEILPATPAHKLVLEEDRVVGVETTSGMRLQANKGVVLATGGYESNLDLVKCFDWLPGFASMFPDNHDGDGLIMAAELGGRIRIVQPSVRIHLGFEFPADENRRSGFRLASIVELCSPHTLVVNKAGRRFANEAFFQEIGPQLREFDNVTHTHPNLPCFLIFDRQYAERFSFGGLPARSQIPDWVTRANSPEELAAKLGVDPTGLSSTVSRFNKFAAAGVDEDFGRGSESWRLDQSDGRVKNPRLGALEKAPFYGVELHPSYSSIAGIEADVNARALHQRGHPIPGLYVTGNTAAMTEYGVGYQAGVSIASAMTYSYLAVKHMMNEGRVSD